MNVDCYILSFYADGSGTPEVRFFDCDQIVDAVRWAIDQKSDAHSVVTGDIKRYDREKERSEQKK